MPGDHRPCSSSSCCRSPNSRAAAPFTVLVPTRLPRGWHRECNYVAGVDRPDVGSEVHLHYYSPSNDEAVFISERASETLTESDFGSDWTAVTPAATSRTCVVATRR